jgi:hypothetical protein
MKIGVFSDSLAKLSRREMFAWCAERGITDVELGVGAWGPWPRPHLDLATIGERKEREKLAGELKEHGLRLAAVNGAGNCSIPIPPSARTPRPASGRGRPRGRLRRQAGGDHERLPAGRRRRARHLPRWATSADDERLFDWQMEHEVGLSGARPATGWPRKPGGDGLPGDACRSHGLQRRRLRGADGLCRAQYRLNMDPSHFWWQGIDPLTW